MTNIKAVNVVQRLFTGSPGRLRLVGGVAALLALGFALGGGWAYQARAAALDDARVTAAQVVRIQAIQTALAEADADATNAFLNGGLEPGALRADYTDSLTQAGSTIAQAAGADARDASALSSVTSSVVRYAGLIEQARANNRQGLPVGSAYLRQASTLLRTEIAPSVAAILAANVSRVAAASDRAQLVSLEAGAGAAILLIGLIWGQWWLAHRVRRVFSVQAATGTVLIVLAAIGGIVEFAQVNLQAQKVRHGSYAATLSLATARIAVFDAKSNESLGLINRGQGAPYEKVYDADTARAGIALDLAYVAGAAGSSAPALKAWIATHDLLRADDDAGNWSAAVAKATGTGQGTSAETFTPLAKLVSTELADQAAAADRGLAAARGPLVVAGILTVIAGLLAAVGMWLGFAQRVEEYR